MNTCRYALARTASLSCLLVIMTLASSVRANTITVTDLSDSLSDLVCDAQCTLREAIASAQDGDTIVWSTSLGFPATTILAVNPADTNGLYIDKNLTIIGPGAHRLELNAQDQSRVLTIGAPATSVTISDLTLSHGRLVGASGAPSPTLIGVTSTPGANVAGGCLYSSIEQLSILRTEIHACALLGGPGANGGSYVVPPKFGELFGTSGTAGGSVFGGAVYSQGSLTLIDSALRSTALSGGGGHGGEGYPELCVGSGSFANTGFGAAGGNVSGAVLYTAGGATLRNVTLHAEAVQSGDGGTGGRSRCGDFARGRGGDGGSIFAGLWYGSGENKASFSTFSAGDYLIGRGGLSRPSAPTADGVFQGRFVMVDAPGSTLTAHKSIFTALASSFPIQPTSYCAGMDITTVNSLANVACATAALGAPELSPGILGPLGITTLPPNSVTSIAINAATDCLDVDGQLVTHDANGFARPNGGMFCDLGAHEDRGVDVFKDDFE